LFVPKFLSYKGKNLQMNICKFPSTSSNKKGRLHQINEICPLMFVKIFLIQVCTQQSANHNLSTAAKLGILPEKHEQVSYACYLTDTDSKERMDEINRLIEKVRRGELIDMLIMKLPV
jgi:hypothetical protein